MEHHNKAVFLDRDGIINREIGDYVWTVEKFEINPGIIELLQKLRAEGYFLVVVTNQAGIAKGRLKGRLEGVLERCGKGRSG